MKRDREAALRRFEAAIELPLLILAIAMIPLLVLPLLVDLPEAVEENAGGSIDSLGDALWWAVTTVTTVGYGDMFPVTPAGRGIAAFLMLAGIALFGVLTANIAAFFVEQDQEDDPMIAKVNDMLERLDRIEKALAGTGDKARVDRSDDFG